MADKTYNINELLEKKKDLEKQIGEEEINKEELVFEITEIRDHVNKDNNRTIQPAIKGALSLCHSAIDIVSATSIFIPKDY